jgi:transcriptional regulator with XRE-family HTH domain
MTRGEKVKYVRTLRGVTQQKLANTTELSPSYISEVETDRSEMSLKSMEKITNVLNIDAAFFKRQFIDNRGINQSKRFSIVR